jgi:putative CocE/NonD family hydrolase
MKPSAILTGTLAAALAAGAPGAARADSAPPIDLLWAVKVPLRDGVRLNATVFKPAGQDRPLPVIFTLTPYNSDTYYARARYFAQNGYVFALVDVRGRGNSEGTFLPFENEGRDGYDVVEWLARQPWCDGKVAMWGGSYAGYDQWATLQNFPPHLATIVPAAAAAMGVDFPAQNNIHVPYLMQWATYTGGVTPQPNLFGDAAFWISKFRELYLSGRPFREFDRMVGNPSPWFQRVLQHPRADDHWRSLRPSAADYARIAIPILTITGHYDDDQYGAMHYYRSHMEHGTAEAKQRHFLIAGPWDHAGTRTPSRDVGGLTFGPASLVDLNALHKAWYDWTLKGGPRPELLKDRIAYYVVPADEWKYAGRLESIASDTRTLYLGSDGSANDVFRSGSLSPARPGPSSPDRYTYDPLDTRPAALETEEIRSYLTDQRYVLNTFGNGVIYTSEPFAAPAEITGYVRFSAWMDLDVPDTDFRVSLYEVLADGTSVLLAEDVKRARYRESLETETLVPSGTVLRYDFDQFPFFSRRVAPGSRLRLFLRCPNSIYLEKNYNSGGVVADETRQNSRTAHVTVYHDAKYPSALTLPVAP